jgi:hypothetical protein
MSPRRRRHTIARIVDAGTLEPACPPHQTTPALGVCPPQGNRDATDRSPPRAHRGPKPRQDMPCVQLRTLHDRHDHLRCQAMPHTGRRRRRSRAEPRARWTCRRSRAPPPPQEDRHRRMSWHAESSGKQTRWPRWWIRPASSRI